MVSRTQRWLALGVVCWLLMGVSPAHGASNTRRARVAVRYLARQQLDNGSLPGFSQVGSTSDAVVAMVAAHRGAGVIDDALDFLAAEVRAGRVDDSGRRAKVVMAAVAGSRDPRDFGKKNLVKQLRNTYTNGRYGNRTDNRFDGVYAHSLAMLALSATRGSLPEEASSWLARAQCPDGGWQFDRPARRVENEHCGDQSDPDDFTRSDTNTTSVAVQALVAAGADVALDAAPFAYFRLARDEVKGGWRYDHRLRPYGSRAYTDSESTALVVQAYAARGRSLPAGSLGALKALQNRLCGRNPGAFAHTWERRDGRLRRTGPDSGVTIGAIPGLLQAPLPVAPFEVTKPAPQPAAC